jgi:hypothetical protein
MSQSADYPLNKALFDLEVFFRKHITRPDELKKFLGYLDECKDEGQIGFRFIHEELMNYRKKYSDYFPFTDSERQMMDDLLYFFG